jgi:hypothetical protein
VLDLSSGFGGRLLGALKSNKVISYTGIEPSTKTFKGLSELYRDFGANKKVHLHLCGSEEFKEKDKYVYASLVLLTLIKKNIAMKTLKVL